MTTNMSKAEAEKRIRSTVLRHATDIEDRKRLQSRIADLIVEAFQQGHNYQMPLYSSNA